MPELRRDPVTRGWVIIAPERKKRPSDFFTKTSEEQLKSCPFCPENESELSAPLQTISSSQIPVSGESVRFDDDDKWEIIVIEDKYPLLSQQEDNDRVGEGMYDQMGGYGHHELIIESKDHNTSVETMSIRHIEGVFYAYQQRIIKMSQDSKVNHVLITRNTGHYAGANIHHPHSHVIGLPIVPKKIYEEMNGAKTYFDYRERCLFCDIIAQELEEGSSQDSEGQSRIVMEDEHFVTFCPYASRFPFEVTIMPKVHQPRFESINTKELQSLSKHIKTVMTAINSILGKPPINYIVHSAPFADCDIHEFENSHTFFHWHIELLPKLTRIAGFEWGSGFYINPVSPEDAASHIRAELEK